jgi:flagellin
MTTINTNLASLYAQKNLGRVGAAMPTAVERLSTGLRINRAKDDAAGLGIAEKIQTQVRATTQSMKNANDAISMVQAAEGSLSEVSSMLQRMKELTIQGRNGSYNTSQRKTLTDEIFALRDEINLVAERTTFNGLSMLKTALVGSVSVGTLDAGQNGWADAGSILTDFRIEEVKASGANVGQYTIAVTATSVTLQAIASTTGLSGVAMGNSIGLSQSINFEDLAREVWGNNDGFDPDAASMNVGASASINLNFDRLGINFKLTESTGAEIAGITDFGGAAVDGFSLTVGTGTMQAVFQAGANTRDTFVVNGFRDVRIFDRNLNYDAWDETNIQADLDMYMSFSRLNDTLKTMAPQSEAVLSADNFTDLANRLEEVITSVTEIRSGLGAQNNRIEFAINNIQAQTEGMTAAMGRIRDTDFAAETANLTRLQILQQAATAMLSQANQMPNVVLSLLR